MLDVVHPARQDLVDGVPAAITHPCAFICTRAGSLTRTGTGAGSLTGTGVRRLVHSHRERLLRPPQLE